MSRKHLEAVAEEEDYEWGDEQAEDGIPDMEDSFDERAAVADAQGKAVAKLDERQKAMMPPALVGQRWIDLKAIHRDGDTQSRVRLDPTIVQDYAQQFTRNAARTDRTTLDSYALWWGEFPPVDVFFDEEYWLADGFHRLAGIYEALSEAGMPHGSADRWRVLCRVFMGNRRDAILYGAGANASHGLRRTNADKRKAVETLLRDKDWQAWTDTEIARRCAVDSKTVGNVRRLLEQSLEIPMIQDRKAGDGRQVETANIGRKVEVDRIRPQRPIAPPPPARQVYVEPAPAKVEDAIVRDLLYMRIDSETFGLALRIASVAQLKEALKLIPPVSEKDRFRKVGSRYELLLLAQDAAQVDALIEAAMPLLADEPEISAELVAAIDPDEAAAIAAIEAEAAQEEAERLEAGDGKAESESEPQPKRAKKQPKLSSVAIINRDLDAYEVEAKAEVEQIISERQAVDVRARRGQATLLRYMLQQARQRVREDFPKLTGRDTLIPPFERAVADLLEPLDSLIAALGGEATDA